MKPRPFSPSAALVIGLISIPIFVGALDLTVVSAVLPRVVTDLEIPPTRLNDAAWIVSGYLLAYTVAMTFMGRLSDLIGRRKVYLLALVIFALGSYWVAVADAWPTHLALRVCYQFHYYPDPARVSLIMLIVGRVIQAFGGGAMVPVGMALAGDLYPPAQRAKALGVIAAIDTSGWVVGHLYGGILTRYLNWRLIFWLNLPICLLGFVLIAIVLRGLPRLPREGKMDWLGAVLISLSLTAVNIGLGSNAESTGGSLNSEGGAGWPRYAVPFLIAAVVFLVLFLWRQARLAYPLVLLPLFRHPNFSLASLANFLVGTSLFIAIANVPLFINTLIANTLEQGAWDSGWMLSGLTVPMALASIPGGWLTVRYGYRWPALAGLLGAIGGFALMSHWQATTPYIVMIPHLMLTGIGFGLTIAPIAAAVINTSPSSYRGTASALVIIFRLIGMTVSVSAVASYGTQRFNYLSTKYLASMNDLTAAGMAATVKVIQETFVMAAVVCVLALLPTFFLKTMPAERNLE
jgi:MFS family permease